MTTRIIRAQARLDIFDILDHLELEAGAATATKFGRSFKMAIDFIVQHPRAAQTRPRLGARVRFGIVQPYNIVYAYNSETDEVTILRVLHGRRRITRKLVQG